VWHEHENLAGDAFLPPQLFRGTIAEVRHRLDQVSQARHGTPKGAGTCDLLLRGWFIFEPDARQALQLAHRSLKHHGPAPPHGAQIHALDIQHGL